jgi:hypothetical protein
MPTLSYKYRIEPNKAQAGALGDMLRDFCGLYNAGRSNGSRLTSVEVFP